MKKSLPVLVILAASAALAGCSSFKLGAGCYIPHGVTGQCSATTVEPGVKPAAAVTAADPKKV